MGKTDYLDALKRALTGLAPDIVAKTLAWYEQRFIDGVTAGRTEAEIAADLDQPSKVAVTLRASTHLAAFGQQKNPVNLLRLLVSAIGLAIFNLFMVVPAIVFAALLTCMYAIALSLYVTGVGVTAGALSGTTELVLDGPVRNFIVHTGMFGDSANFPNRVQIDVNGIHMLDDPIQHPAINGQDEQDDGGQPKDVRMQFDMANESRTVQTVAGLTMVLVGIILTLISLVVTKYTLISAKRYVEMNFSILRGR